MTDYTPTTEYVREAFASAGLGDGSHMEPEVVRAENRADFNRWFRAELARAWDESEDAWVDFYENPALPQPVNPYRKETGDE